MILATGSPAAETGVDGRLTVALEGGHGQLSVQSFRHGPLAPLDDLRSLAPADASAVAAARRVFGSATEALVSARGWSAALDARPMP